MTKYSIIELSIKNGLISDFDNRNTKEQNYLKARNAIYVYRSTKTKKMYIGQTKHFIDEHKQHYDEIDRNFNLTDFDKVIIIFSEYFNEFVLNDVESQLIAYFVADNSDMRSVNIGFNNDVINRTGSNNVKDCHKFEDIALEVIQSLWEKELYERGWVNSKTLDKLRAKELFKYSPIKMLTVEQCSLINEIIGTPNKNYVINGDAGTGKTVLLTHLVANILKNRPKISIGVVVQPNWEKIGKSIFKDFRLNSCRLSITTSTKLIKEKRRYDVIIVDESHKLSRNYSKQHPSFNSVYKIPEFQNCGSHLEILQKLGNQIILMYDVLQAIRPCNVTRDMFKVFTSSYEKKFLSTQFRIKASVSKKYTSDDYINGIKYLLYKDTGLLNSDKTKFNPNFNRDVFRDKSGDAYFGYFTEQPLHNLINWLETDLHSNPDHINRILGGLVEDWRQSDGKDPSIKHWHEGDIHRRWNSTQENWINSDDTDSKEQIGSVFAVQGIDLNKVGVLIGKDIQIDKNGKLFAEPECFFNVNGVFTNDEMEVEENRYEFTLFVLNIYYVLLTRGIDGIRLGFWENDEFRKYMESTLNIK